MATLAQLHDDLDSVEQAKRDAVKLGRQYAITGSHSGMPQAIKVLEAERVRLMRQIRLYRGQSSRVATNFGSPGDTPTLPVS